MIQAAFPVMASKQEHHAHSCGEGRPTELEGQPEEIWKRG